MYKKVTEIFNNKIRNLYQFMLELYSLLNTHRFWIVYQEYIKFVKCSVIQIMLFFFFIYLEMTEMFVILFSCYQAVCWRTGITKIGSVKIFIPFELVFCFIWSTGLGSYFYCVHIFCSHLLNIDPVQKVKKKRRKRKSQ